MAGVVFLDGREASRSLLDRLAAEYPHAGPDGIGFWHAGCAGMLRFRHATTPEAITEQQPWVKVDSGNAIAFDGRLDNRSDLLPLLSPALPPSAPDCAITLHLYEQFGDAFLNRLAGDYALAIWSPRERTVFCARSPMGWRPFLWTFDGARFAFATQPRVLINGLGLERRLNEGVVGEYLSARFVSQDETFWLGVQRLPGGCALLLKNGHIRTWCWHRGPFPDYSSKSEAEHVETFRALFDQALIATARSSSEVVAQLSGGLDSSSVVCRGTELYRSGRLIRPLRAESVRYPGQPQDETEWSSQVEAHLGIEATIAHPQPYDLDEARQWCKQTLHLPLRSNVLMASCRRLRREGVRVLLTGEGGDDWLAGRREHWPDLVRNRNWSQLFTEGISRRPSVPLYRRFGAIALHAAGPLVSARRRDAALRPHLDFSHSVPSWINAGWARRIQLQDRWRGDCMAATLPSYAQNQRFQNYQFARRYVNWENSLAYADGHGLEIRHPFHDLRLTHFLMGAAGGYLRYGEQSKHLLRESMRGTLPEPIRTRQGKANFTASVVDALTDRFLERAPSELRPVKLGWIDGNFLAESHRQHLAWRNAGASGDRPKLNYGVVWFAAAMDLWLEHAFGSGEC